MTVFDARSIRASPGPTGTGFIRMTAHSRRCLEATQELAGLLGDAL